MHALLQRRVKEVLDLMADAQSDYHHAERAALAEDLPPAHFELWQELEAVRLRLSDAWKLAEFPSLRKDWPYLPDVSDATPGAMAVRGLLINVHAKMVECRSRLDTLDGGEAGKAEAARIEQRLREPIRVMRQQTTLPELAYLKEASEKIAVELETLQTEAAAAAVGTLA